MTDTFFFFFKWCNPAVRYPLYLSSSSYSCATFPGPGPRTASVLNLNFTSTFLEQCLEARFLPANALIIRRYKLSLFLKLFSSVPFWIGNFFDITVVILTVVDITVSSCGNSSSLALSPITFYRSEW